jgi:RNA polymerase sigma factor (sigma-70 family)
MEVVKMEELYTQYKALLFTLAYQLTGSSSDAEDVVQDVFLKVQDVNPKGLAEEPKAYLCKMVTNRCRDLHKSARKQREQYFGEWLPEPIPTSNDETLESIVRDELLSYAMLVLLEKLSPAGRAVFVLRESLGFEYADIAEIIGKSEANSRKLFSRARGKMGISFEESVHFESASETWVRQFLAALEQDNVDKVVSMLAKDVVLISDGGGKAFTAVHPIESRDFVSRFLLGLVHKFLHYEEGMQIEIRDINGQTGLIVRSGGGIEAVALIHVEDNSIRTIYVVRNPDKLRLFST